MRTRVFLLLGSNLGDRAAQLHTARMKIGAMAGNVVSESAVYETAAWGSTDQPAFLNQAVGIDTTLQPGLLLSTLLAIEESMGRIRKEKWGPRSIDIDILFYGDQVINEADLTVPHLALPVRRFALTPLCDIAQDFIHPVLQKSVRELLDECPDDSKVKKIK